MESDFWKSLNKEELLERVSSMSQLAGARFIKYTEGKASGVKAAEITTGSGLNFSVLLDRGMDITDAYYNNIPIGWKSKMGVAAPTFFEHQGSQWLRTFHGGLLTTCGLMAIGEPCEDQGVFYGLHGRISHTPAENCRVDEFWEGEDYIIKLTGKMRESILYDENITLTREIKSIFGQKKIYIRDVVENESYNETPFMIMYHINIPFPIVSENSVFYSSAKTVKPEQEWCDEFSRLSKPVRGYRYATYVHMMPVDRDKVYMLIVNEELKLGVYIAFDPKALPIGNQWKMLGMQDYVVAMEPSNTFNVGRAESRKQGWLPTLAAKEKAEFILEIGVLDGEKEIDSVLRLI